MILRGLLITTSLICLLGTPQAFGQDAEYDASTVVATVDGTDITLGHMIAMRGRLPQQYQSMPNAQLFPGLLEQLIDQTVLANSLTGEEPLDVRLALENERRAMLAGIGVQNVVSGDLDEDEIQATYDEAIAGFEPQPEYNASHILVTDEDRAKELRAEIVGGADFGTVAQANSSDGSAASGGSLGWFGPGRMVPAFEAAVIALEAGEVSEPVQTQFGWHIIKLNEVRDTTPPTLEEARPQIEEQLRQTKLRDRIETLRGEAEISLPETGIPADAIGNAGLLTE